MRYVIRKQCHIKIEEFYRNVAKKYRYTYSRQLMQKNVLDATKALYQIGTWQTPTNGITHTPSTVTR